MPGSQRVSGSVAKEIRMVQTVQTASAEQLTSLQPATFPLQYHNNISAETILTTFFFLLVMSHCARQKGVVYFCPCGAHCA